MQQDDTPTQPLPVPPAALVDFYADSASVQLSYAGVTLQFQRSGVHVQGGIPTALIRLSPQTALLLSKLLPPAMDAYQERFGTVSVPADILDSMGIKEHPGDEPPGTDIT